MTATALYFDTVVDVLLESDEDCLALIRATEPGAGFGHVQLIEGPVTAAEALAYARTLLELGQGAVAREILVAVLYGQRGGAVVPQGGQRRALPETLYDQ